MTRLLPALAALTALCAVLPVDAHAQTRPGWEIGADVFDYSYKETFEGQEIHDDGVFVGGRVGYTWTRGAWNIKARADIAAGSVDYRFEDETLDDVGQAVGQLEVLVGRDILLSGGQTLTPFAGVGARSLSDGSGGEVTNQGSTGYDRLVSYQYIPVGLTFTTPSRANRSLTLSGQYNWVIGGSSKSYFADIDPTTENVEVDFTDGYGFEASAMINFHRGARLLSAGPYVRYWNLDQSRSAIVTEGPDTFEIFEPANTTWQTGLRVTYAF